MLRAFRFKVFYIQIYKRFNIFLLEYLTCKCLIKVMMIFSILDILSNPLSLSLFLSIGYQNLRLSLSINHISFSLHSFEGRVLHVSSHVHCTNPKLIVLIPNQDLFKPQQLNSCFFSRCSELFFSAATHSKYNLLLAASSKIYLIHFVVYIKHSSINFFNLY